MRGVDRTDRPAQTPVSPASPHSPDRAFAEALMRWYRENRRDLPWRQDRDPYHVWVSEIMLQQTRVEAAKAYYLRFMDALPDIPALASASEDTLLKLWQGLGYYNRVRNLQRAAVVVRDTYGGRMPSEYAALCALPGIGPYTAGAIASICFDRRTPAVDGNVLRVGSRLLADDSDVKSPALRRRVTALLADLYPERNCGDFTQGLIELGALVCVPAGKPRCALCPVADWCRARAEGRAMEFPVRAAGRTRKHVEKTVFLLQCGEWIAVERRPATGLLAGMYQFPNVDRALEAAGAVAQAEAWQVRPRALERRVERRHVFTHVEWEMTGYYLQVEAQPDCFRWVDRRELAQEVPLPTAFAQFLEELP